MGKLQSQGPSFWKKWSSKMGGIRSLIRGESEFLHPHFTMQCHQTWLAGKSPI
jgi:hypothetical protein